MPGVNLYYGWYYVIKPIIITKILNTISNAYFNQETENLHAVNNKFNEN